MNMLSKLKKNGKLIDYFVMFKFVVYLWKNTNVVINRHQLKVMELS